MSKHMDDVMLAAENEPTAGKAVATCINGIAALVENADLTDEATRRVVVREIRREAGAMEEIVSRKRASEPETAHVVEQAAATDEVKA